MYKLKYKLPPFEEDFFKRYKKSWSREKEKKVKDVFSDYFELPENNDKQSYSIIIKHSNKLKLNPSSQEVFLKDTNFKDLIIQDIEHSIEKYILELTCSRYQITTPYSLLKQVLKIKWVTKDRLKKVIMDLDKKFKFTTINVISKTKKQFKQITTEVLMFPLSIRGVHVTNKPWKKSFPEEYTENNRLFIQGGDSGVVLSQKGSYQTAFVEVFPKFIKNNNGTFFSAFIRGEGVNLKKAEEDAFNLLEKIKQCSKHDWERVPKRTDGYAKCKKCKVRSMELDPLTKCNICNIPTNFNNDKDNNYYCKDHYYSLDEDQAIDINAKESFWSNPAEELHRFRINKKIYLLYKDEFEVKKDLFWNRVSSLKVKIFPLFGESLMTKEEFNQYLLDNFETLLSEF